MLADGEYVEAQLVRQLSLLEELPHALLGLHSRREIGKGGDSKLHCGRG